MTIRNKYLLPLVVLAVIATFFLTACNQPVNQTDPASDSPSDTVASESADADNVSQTQTTSESEIVKTGQHECKFEELKNEVDDDGTQYRYGNLVFSVEVHAGSGSEEVDATLLAELPLILITDPDGSVRYESHARWLTMRQKWFPSNVHYNPPWYADVINSALWPKYSGEGVFLDFLATICNDEGKKFTFTGYVEFVPSEL